MPRKNFCFRFDVDTHKCLIAGVPNLLKLGEELNVKFTFFINFGQSVDLLSFLKRKLLSSQDKVAVKRFSPLFKLGIKDYLIAAIYNPMIGKGYPKLVKKIVDSGHEVGLHGGRNHETWFSDAKNWSLREIREELLWGYEVMKGYLKKESIYGFASPGANGSEKVNKLLKDLGFSYVADLLTDKPLEKIISVNKLKIIPTNIVGVPGGVGYIEHCRVLGMTDPQILDDFRSKLNDRKRLAITYDHPYYVGVRELLIVKKMVNLVKEMGYKVTMMREIIKEQ